LGALPLRGGDERGGKGKRDGREGNEREGEGLKW